MHIVIIGAVALGPKAACRFKRLMPEGRVTLIDRSGRISYGGCGIPYFVSGEVNRIEDLQSTQYGMVRDANFFRRVKGVDVLTRTEALSVDRPAKTVRVRDLDTGQERDIGYDRLVLATGSRPKRPPIPGLELAGVSTASTLEEAEAIRDAVSRGRVKNAVMVGASLVGLEMAVALGDLWGIPAAVVDFAPQLLPATMPPLLARMLARDLEDHGVSLHCGEKVLRFEGENGHVTRVVTENHVLDADLVVLGTGIAPNTELAASAGLGLTEINGEKLIAVDEHLRTTDPDIYSGGDCVAIRHHVTGKPFWLPLGSQANRQGRVIGTNLASQSGAAASFPGAAGAWGVKLFDQSAAGAGLTLAAARQAGYDAAAVHVEYLDRAHFYPEHAVLSLELVVDRPTRRILGIQGVSADGDALTGRINAVTPYLASGGAVADLSNLELIYTPPFASAMDAINTLGNAAENMLEGRLRTMDPQEFITLWENRAEGKAFFLDARDRISAEGLASAHPQEWTNIPQDLLRDHLAEIPKDTSLVLVCNTGLRAYEAQLVLDECGFTNSRVVSGGLTAVRRAGMEVE